MTDEYFYGVTLKSADPSQVWDPFSTEDGEETGIWNKLLVKQIVLGHEAAEDEFNVVEVCTQTVDDAIQIPIAVLRVGEARSVSLNLEFVSPVLFKLVKGSGPVHIHGHHLIGEPNDTDIWNEETMLEEEEEDEADLPVGENEEGENGGTRRKQKFPNNIKGGGVGAKIDTMRNKRKL
ncbi:Nucleoplasmin-like protein [Sergentomyia squamirostris]